MIDLIETTSSNKLSICKGDSIYIIDHFEKVAGTYIDSLNNHLGCDSIVITDLKVNNLPVVNLGKDASMYSNESITLNAGTGFIKYKWNTGDTTRTIKVNGAEGTGKFTYSVIVTDTNKCRNSDTIKINITTEITDFVAGITCKVYPNPVNRNKLYITADAVDRNMVFALYNTKGHLVKLITGEHDSITGLEHIDKGHDYRPGAHRAHPTLERRHLLRHVHAHPGGLCCHTRGKKGQNQGPPFLLQCPGRTL